MKFRLVIQGHKFRTTFDDSHELRDHGFFVIAHVEASSDEEAEHIAYNLLRTHKDLRKQQKNWETGNPQLTTNEIVPVEDWPVDVARPLTGLVWYPEKA